MASSHSTAWILLWCEEDNSYSLVRDNQVVFDKDNLSIGDTVSFFYGKHEFKGVVKRTGGDDEHRALLDEMDRLNKLNKSKQESFHDDRPRRAATRSNEAIKRLTGGTLKPGQKTSGGSGSKGKRQISTVEPVRKQKLSKGNSGVSQKVDTPEETDTLSSSDSSDNEPLINRNSKPASHGQSVKDVLQLKLLHSAQEKNSSNALNKGKNSLKEYMEECMDPTLSDSERKSSSVKPGSVKLSGLSVTESVVASESESPPVKAGSVKLSGLSDTETAEANDNDEGDGCSRAPINVDSEEGEGGGEEEKSGSSKQKNHGTSNARNKSKTSSGHSTKKLEKCQSASEPLAKMDLDVQLDPPSPHPPSPHPPSSSAQGPNSVAHLFRYKALDKNVLELKGNKPHLCGIYIHEDDLRAAKDASCNASKYARQLTQYVFSDEALLTCSLSGGEFRAGGRERISKKPGLPSTAVETIIDVAVNRQAARNWNPRLDRRTVRVAMRQKLVDWRKGRPSV